MRPIRIVPEYTLLLTYNIRPETHEPYFRYIVNDFTPALQEHHLYLQNAWHILYGNAPERQVEYITDSLENIHGLFASQRWEHLEATLTGFITDYTRRILRYTGNFKV